MCNWCTNNILFHGNNDKLDHILEEFERMADRQLKLNEGQQFEDIPIEDGYFFDITIDHEFDNIEYQTKHVPNLIDVLNIAIKYKVDFMLDYEELGFNEYGQYMFSEGILKHRELTSDFIREILNEDDDNSQDLLWNKLQETDWNILPLEEFVHISDVFVNPEQSK